MFANADTDDQRTAGTRTDQTFRFALADNADAIGTRQLGNGFLEAVYQEALAIELASRGIQFQKEVELPISYKGACLKCGYRADFVCFDGVIVELKALRALSGSEEAQIINYLKASGYRTGLLLNFGAARLDFKRYVHGGWAGFDLRPSAKSRMTSGFRRSPSDNP